MKLTVIIPVYNEVNTICELIQRVKDVTINKEIIVVDDFSSDGTRELLKNISDIKVIYFSENKGKGTAVRIGLQHSTGDIVIIQDADLEYNPMDYHKLINPIINGTADAVYGSRFKGKGKFLFRFWLANRIIVFITNLLFVANLSDVLSCYRCIRREVLESLNLTAKRFEIEAEITAKLLRKRYRIIEVPISYFSRIEGKKINILDGIKILIILVRLKIS